METEEDARLTEPVIETAGVEDRFSRVCRLMGLVVLVLVLACAFTPWPDLLAKRLETPRGLGRADAIVALGAGVQRDDTLNIASMRRAMATTRPQQTAARPRKKGVKKPESRSQTPNSAPYRPIARTTSSLIPRSGDNDL